jgi:RimJ/RimL family protein N-acetyltransferase
MISAWANNWSCRTGRLRLAKCDMKQAAHVADIISDPQVQEPYCVGRSVSDTSILAADKWLQTKHGWRNSRELNLVACKAESGEAVGYIQFNHNRIGYFVAPRFWRQGLGREMVLASCEQVAPLLSLQVLEATVIRENIGSRRILEQCGFFFDGLTTAIHSATRAPVAMLRYRRFVP